MAYCILYRNFPYDSLCKEIKENKKWVSPSGGAERVLGVKSSLTFHWQELGHMTTPNAKEPGKCGP